MKKTALLLCAILVLPALIFAATDKKKLDFVKDRKTMTATRMGYLKGLLKEKAPELPPILLACLNDRKDDVKFRVACADGIDVYDYKEAVPDLLRIVQQEGGDEDTGKPEDQEEDYDVRLACAKALAGFDDKEVAIDLGLILGKMRDALGGVTNAIVDELGKSKFKNEPEVLQGCSMGLRHRKKEIREKVVGILGAVNDKKVLSMLMLAMEDKEPSVRKLAIGYVAKIGGKLVNVTLIDALEEEKDSKVKEQIADELIKIEISPLRQVWIDKLMNFSAMEPSPAVKTKLKKAADRFKKGASVIK